jgi:toxin ParE1/3/4
VVLQENPAIGSPRRFRHKKLQGIRMWPIKEFPHVLLFYLTKRDEIEIVRILHGARDLPRLL